MEEGRWEWVGSARTYFVSRALFMLPDVISYIAAFISREIYMINVCVSYCFCCIYPS